MVNATQNTGRPFPQVSELNFQGDAVKTKMEGGESRRAFLKGVAMTGAFSMMSAASAKGDAPGGKSNPIVPNAPTRVPGAAPPDGQDRA